MHRGLRRAAVTIALFTCLIMSAVAEDWPGWRGPRGDGTSSETNVPVRWSETENVRWKIELDLPGHSSPVVWDGRLFLTGADLEAQQRVLLSVDRRTGEVLWRKTVVAAPLEKKHKLNSWASGTPATDGSLVYVTFLDEHEMVVAAYDFAGDEVWAVRPGKFSSVHGYCSSPVLFEDKLIVNGDHDGDAYIVALDRATGRTLWKTDRENKTRSYCTPIIREFGGRTQLVLSGSKCVASYDPRDGSRHWVLDGPTEQFVASVVENEGLLFVTGGYPDRHVIAVDPTGSGRLSESEHIKWRHYRTGASYVPSPVAVGRHFFLVSDNGIASCYDAKTGTVEWQERIGPHYSASLVATAEHVYFLDDEARMKVVKAGPGFEVVAENKLDDFTYASPAISDGEMFIRGDKKLYCISTQSTAGANGRESRE